MARIDTEWSASVSEDCYFLQFNVAGAPYRTSLDELLRWGKEAGEAVIGGAAAQDYFTLRYRTEPNNPHDRNAIAVDLCWPGGKKLFGGRKPATYRHCGYVPAELAEAIHSSGLLSETDQLLLVLDHFWYGDDNPAAFRIAVNLVVDGDEWESLHTNISECGAWGSVGGIGLIAASGGRTFRGTRGSQPTNLYPKVVG